MATIVRSARRGAGGTGGAVVSAGTWPGARAGGRGMTPVVSDCETGGGSGARGVSCGIPAAGELPAPARPSPGSGTAPSLSRTPAADGAGGAAASGGRRGISV